MSHTVHNKSVHVKVLYIMGMWASGSTILDIVLGNHPRIESVGELRQLPHLILTGRERCSCGEAMRDCEYWGAVRDHWERDVGPQAARDLAALQDKFERFRDLPRLSLQKVHCTTEFLEYRRLLGALYRSIAAVSDKPLIVDSSKYPYRAYAALQNRQLDTVILHVIRDGRAVVWSGERMAHNMLGDSLSDSDRVHLAREIALRWFMLNYISDSVLRASGESGIRVRYEDFVSKPDAMLHHIGDFLNLDMHDVAKQLEQDAEFKVGHLVAGNRIRLKGSVRLKADLEWQRKLSSESRCAFWRIAEPLEHEYGYGSGSQSSGRVESTVTARSVHGLAYRLWFMGASGWRIFRGLISVFRHTIHRGSVLSEIYRAQGRLHSGRS